MNPHATPSISPTALVQSLVGNRHLIIQMGKREVIGRYKGSVLGLAWSFFNPILMLVVYTFVFSVVFKARWAGIGEETKTQFAIVLFAGLIVHSLFSEVLNRAPGLILNNVNYVKRIVFPLEILPAVIVGGALFHAVISLFVLLIAFGLLLGPPPATVFLAPVVLLPLAMLSLGIAWILAALGVFVRDLGHVIGLISTMLLFLSPIFFPLSALPAAFHPFVMANPLTFVIEEARKVLIWGQLPDWRGLAIYTIIAIGVAFVGYAWFQKTRKGFGDVL